MEKQGIGILCRDCLGCLHFSEYQTSNGALPRCELDDICLSLGPKGTVSEISCPACLKMPSKSTSFQQE